jgi:hypothetical protein
MSGINAYARRGKEKKGLIISSFKRVLGEMALRDRWLPAELLRDYIHSKYSIGDEIEFKTTDMIRELSKLLPNTSTTPNRLEIEDGIELDVYFQHKKRCYFFYCTVEFGVLPTFPTARNSSEWEDSDVIKRLLATRRKGEKIGESVQPESKKCKSAATADVASASTPSSATPVHNEA